MAGTGLRLPMAQQAEFCQLMRRHFMTLLRHGFSLCVITRFSLQEEEGTAGQQHDDYWLTPDAPPVTMFAWQPRSPLSAENAQ